MLISALVLVGWISVYLLLRQMLLRSIERLDSDLRDQLQSLRNQVQQSHPAQNEPAVEVGSRADRESLSEEEMDSEGFDRADEEYAGVDQQDVSALRTTLSAIAAGKVRIRSVREIPTSNGLSNAWAREGCVLVQNSHDIEVSKNRVRALPPSMLRGRPETK